MGKIHLRIEYSVRGSKVAEIDCTRYVFNPIGSEGFLMLEDEDEGTTAYIQLSKVLKVVAAKEGAPAAEVTPDQVVKVGHNKMILSKPIMAARYVKELDNEIGVGDKIAVGHYTATCQKITERGALFFMDQYDDDPQRMNDDGTNEGGYEKSDLRRRINNEESLKDFGELRSRLVPFENGDLIRIPTVEELFGEKECDYDDGSEWAEHLGGEQLPLMISRANRIVFRKNESEWGWLQNKRLGSASNFALVDNGGVAAHYGASNVGGVRRAFLIK